MAKEVKTVSAPKEPPPRIYLRDEQIKKFAGESFEKLEVGDTMEVTFKVKVTGQNINTETDYDEKGDAKGPKTHRSIDLELVEKEGKKEKSNVEKALDTIGKKARY